MVQLERRGSAANLKRAATLNLPESLINPSLGESNITDLEELTSALNDLAASAGLLKQKRWSVSLPEAASRSLIITLESRPSSSAELEEILGWKMERGFGENLDDLTISRERLSSDEQGRDRYLVVATRSSVLAEFEGVLSALGWRAGLILPRHVGEGLWLTANGAQGDSLLLSSSEQGFTAVVFRGKQPLIVRTVNCGADECEDELYRLLLYYRDRRGGETGEVSTVPFRMLVVGDVLPKERVAQIVNETLSTDVRALDAEDLGLHLASRELDFDAIAAPAGLATLAWN
jgi:Tfp pilus assembly PilM family ATPase